MKILWQLLSLLMTSFQRILPVRSFTYTCYDFCVMAVCVSVLNYANFLSDAFLLFFCRWVFLAYDNWDFRKSFDYSQSPIFP